jgi:hypothetical protein
MEGLEDLVSFLFFYQYKWDQSLHCVLVHTNDKISLPLPAIMYEQNGLKPVPSLAMSK